MIKMVWERWCGNEKNQPAVGPGPEAKEFECGFEDGVVERLDVFHAPEDAAVGLRGRAETAAREGGREGW